MVFPLEPGCWYPLSRAGVHFTGSSDLRNRWCFGALLKASIHNNHSKTRFFFLSQAYSSMQRGKKRSVLYLLLLEKRDGLVLTSLCFAEAQLRYNYSDKESSPPSDGRRSSAREFRDACTQPKRVLWITEQPEPAPAQGLSRSRKVSALGMPSLCCFGREMGMCTHPGSRMSHQSLISQKKSKFKQSIAE